MNKRTWSWWLPSPAMIITLILCEIVFWTSPQWAQNIHFPTREAQIARQIEYCQGVVARHGPAPSLVIVHETQALATLELKDWTPHRVEAVYDSGLTVVSTLNPGPHGELQTLIHDLDLPVGTTFRVFNGKIIEVS